MHLGLADWLHYVHYLCPLSPVLLALSMQETTVKHLSTPPTMLKCSFMIYSKTYLKLKPSSSRTWDRIDASHCIGLLGLSPPTAVQADSGSVDRFRLNDNKTRLGFKRLPSSYPRCNCWLLLGASHRQRTSNSCTCLKIPKFSRKLVSLQLPYITSVFLPRFIICLGTLR